MFAILMFLGAGAAVAAVMAVVDAFDSGSGGEAASETESYGPEDDVVASSEYSSAITDLLDDLVTEGEITQAEADASLGGVDFVNGVLDVATGEGDDAVFGSSGDDRIDTGTGDDSVLGGLGDDLVRLGDGSDLYGFDERSATGVDDIIAFPQDGGGFGADSIAEGGDDTVIGGAGADFIADGYGANLVQGQQGDDFIVTVDQDGFSPDTVEAGFGNDMIFVDEGDVVTVGNGLDRITVDLWNGVSSDYSVVTITDFDPSRDVLELEGSGSLLRTPTPSGPDDVVTNPVTVEDLDDGTGAVVMINDIPVVLVMGGQGMTVSNIRLST